MMRVIFSVLLMLSSTLLIAQRIPLKFNENGKFKIIQITDTHYTHENPKSEVVPALLNEIIEQESPDLLVFTGDMVWKNDNTKEALDALFEPVIAHKIPWAYVFGNHDDEAEMSRKEIMDYVVQKPYCLATDGDAYLSGVGNYVLEINDREDKKIEAVLYCMDSHSYAQSENLGTYAWFTFDQIDWYRKQSLAYKTINNDQPINALAFFHIPLPEYAEMKASDKELLIGSKDEKECPGLLNTGMFAAMRTSGDVMGAFVGHDHNNDYIGIWHDICLAYGRFSGGNTVYNDLGNNGCRVIELEEGKREFSTYIRLLGGEILHEVHYPTTFIKEGEN